MSEAVPKQLEPNGSAVRVAGVDGCRGGWLYVVASIGAGGGLQLEACGVAANFRELIEATINCAAVAVDIPIGLSDDGRREADSEARRRLGPRRSSVFPAPARCLLATGSYPEANAVSRSVVGKGLSAQAYGILDKIRDTDAAMTPELQSRIVESHPEVSFWSLAGDEPLAHYKRTPDGASERLRLLETVFGPEVRDLTKPRAAGWDDLYDACVLSWTASHVARGDAVHLPAQPQYDARGLRMEIVY